MFEKQCRLARAAKYYKGGGGGGSGSGSINIPSLNQTLGQAEGMFPSISRLYRGFTGSEPFFQQQGPILKQLGDYGMQAANQFKGVPGQLLQRADQFRQNFMGVPGDILRGARDLRSQFQNVPRSIIKQGEALHNQFQGLPGQIMSQFQDLPGQYLDVMKGQLGIAQTGDLTQDQRNQAVQEARAGAQARGDMFSNSGIFAEALNRRKYADARQQQAIGNIQSLGQAALGTALQRDQGAQGLGIGLQQAVMGADQGAFGIGSGLQNAVMGLQQGAQGMALGREQGTMGLQQGGMGIAQGNEQLLGYPSEQLTKGELGQVGAFQSIFGPEENLAGDWLKAQAGADVAGAGNAQSQQNNKMGTVATIIGGIATAY